MKRQSSTREYLKLSKILFSQENIIKSAIDELSTLESIIQLWESDFYGYNSLLGFDRTVIQPQLIRQSKIYKRVLFEFPLKRLSQHIDGFYKHCEATASVMMCFSEYRFIAKSPDLSNDDVAFLAFDKSMEHLEKSLELIQEVKNRNGII